MSDLSKAGDWFRQHLLSDEQKAWLEQAQRDREIMLAAEEFFVAERSTKECRDDDFTRAAQEYDEALNRLRELVRGARE